MLHADAILEIVLVQVVQECPIDGSGGERLPVLRQRHSLSNDDQSFEVGGGAESTRSKHIRVVDARKTTCNYCIILSVKRTHVMFSFIAFGLRFVRDPNIVSFGIRRHAVRRRSITGVSGNVVQ